MDFSTLLTMGSFTIAAASGLGVGAAGATVLQSKGVRPFVMLFGVMLIAAIAGQYCFWNAVAHGTRTDGKVVFPSGIGAQELFEVLVRQSVVLALAFHLVRKDARKQMSESAMLLHGVLSAPLGFVIGTVLEVLLALVLAVGCFTGMETCHF